MQLDSKKVLVLVNHTEKLVIVTIERVDVLVGPQEADTPIFAKPNFGCSIAAATSCVSILARMGWVAVLASLAGGS